MWQQETILIRRFLKRLLPLPVVRTLAAVFTYGQRMSAWMHVLRTVTGRSAADKAVVRRSAAYAPMAMLSNLNVWREPSLIADAEVDVKSLGAFAVRGNSDDLGHVLLQTHEAIFSVIAKHLHPGEKAIDAGANIGAVTVFLARQVGPSGQVVAVEMMPETAARLRRNLALNNLANVTVVEQALSSQAGERVTAEVAEGVFGQASIAAGTNRGRAVRRLEVLTTTLDHISTGLNDIAVLKMDLEGAEQLALAGAQEMLKRTRAIIFESWSSDDGQTASLLRAAGFVISPIDGRNFLAHRGETAIGKTVK